jgi:glycosyltransferase involved in cell wall biosynthesis
VLKQVNIPITDYTLTGGLRSQGLYKVNFAGKPLVSIITVVYNGKKAFDKTVESVLNQTYDNIEYLVIDGGSTDGTIDLIRSYEDKIDYWVSEPDQGISDGFNKGIMRANGDIIGIINSDDWFELDTVRKVVDVFLSTDAHIVHGMMQLWENGKKSDLISANYNLVSLEMTVNHPTLFVRRECYEKMGLYLLNFQYAMDYEWILRVKTKGAKSVYINYCIANMNAGGISSVFWRKALKEVLLAQQLHNPRCFNYIFWAWQNIKGTFSRFFNWLGMEWLVRFYHANLSTVKKLWMGD